MIRNVVNTAVILEQITAGFHAVAADINTGTGNQPSLAFLLSAEGGILSLLQTVGYLWMGLLLFIGMMVTHNYTVGKNALTCVATIVGMAFIMFMGLLFSSLMGKMVSFVTNIIDEISYRL